MWSARDQLRIMHYGLQAVTNNHVDRRAFDDDIERFEMCHAAGLVTKDEISRVVGFTWRFSITQPGQTIATKCGDNFESFFLQTNDFPHKLEFVEGYYIYRGMTSADMMNQILRKVIRQNKVSLIPYPKSNLFRWCIKEAVKRTVFMKNQDEIELGVVGDQIKQHIWTYEYFLATQERPRFTFLPIFNLPYFHWNGVWSMLSPVWKIIIQIFIAIVALTLGGLLFNGLMNYANGRGFLMFKMPK